MSSTKRFVEMLFIKYRLCISPIIKNDFKLRMLLLTLSLITRDPQLGIQRITLDSQR